MSCTPCPARWAHTHAPAQPACHHNNSSGAASKALHVPTCLACFSKRICCIEVPPAFPLAFPPARPPPTHTCVPASHTALPIPSPPNPHRIQAPTSRRVRHAAGLLQRVHQPLNALVAVAAVHSLQPARDSRGRAGGPLSIMGAIRNGGSSFPAQLPACKPAQSTGCRMRGGPSAGRLLPSLLGNLGRPAGQ